MPSTECFYLDKNGKRQDAKIHEAILDNPAAEKAQAERAIKRAIESGLTESEARDAYGI